MALACRSERRHIVAGGRIEQTVDGVMPSDISEKNSAGVLLLRTAIQDIYFGRVWFTDHRSQARRREPRSLRLGRTHARSLRLVACVSLNRLQTNAVLVTRSDAELMTFFFWPCTASPHAPRVAGEPGQRSISTETGWRRFSAPCEPGPNVGTSNQTSNCYILGAWLNLVQEPNTPFVALGAHPWSLLPPNQQAWDGRRQGHEAFTLEPGGCG
jgi:hypothetical protein